MNDERLIQLLKLTTIQKWYVTKDNKPKSIKIKWEDKFLLCLEYENESGKIQDNTIHKEILIGIWLGHQKSAIQGKGKRKITENQQMQLFRLLSIKEWYQNLTKDFKWINMCKLCLEYEQLMKENIKPTTEHKTVKIDQWIADQKKSIKGQSRGMMNEIRLIQLLKSRTFCEWYINSQNECLPQFQEFYLPQIITNESSVQLDILSPSYTSSSILSTLSPNFIHVPYSK